MIQKYYKYTIIGLLAFLFWIYLQGTIDKTLLGELIPVKIPEEFYKVNQWLEKQQDGFKITWLPPQFDARILDWASDRKINDFLTRSSGKPTIAPQASFSKLYYLFFETAINNVPRLDKFFDILNSKYLIFRIDLPEDYSKSLLNNLKNNPNLEEVNLTNIDPELFCKQSTSLKKDSGETQEKEYFAICDQGRESYLQIFENRDFASQFWVPENINLVVGGMETLDILNSQEDFHPINQGLIFVNQGLGILEKIRNLKFKNIIFNNTNFEDLVFSLVEKKYSVELASLTSEGKKEWKKASTQEPLHGEWHRVIDELRIPNWDFDFEKNLIYSEGRREEITAPFQIEDEGKHVLIIRYFQNNRGGKFNLIFKDKEKIIDTLDLNNKFITQTFNLNSLKKGKYSLRIQNLIGFNAINLIALVPERKYHQYQEIAQEILKNNRIIYIQKTTPEMTIEPLKFDLPRATNYEVLLRLKSAQNETDKEKEKEQGEGIKEENQLKEKIGDAEGSQKEDIENKLYFGNKRYDLTLDPLQNITWLNLGKKFFQQKEEISIYQRTKPVSILNVDNFFILDQGNLELKEETRGNPELPTAIKVSNLIPQMETLKGAQVSEKKGRIITDAIKVKEYQNFYLEYKFQGQNLKGVEARVLFYGSDYDPIYQRTAFQVEDFMDDQIGNVEQEKISHFFGTPRKTHYIKIEFKAEPNLEEESWFEISDFKLFPEESLGAIDTLVFSEVKENQAEKTTKPIIEYEKINPTKYTVSFSQIKEPFVLAFAESYDPLWKLKEENSKGYFQKRFDSLFSQNNDPIPSFPLYSVINGFYIDPQKLNNNELVLEYQSQNWFEAGLWVSGLSMGLSLTVFMIYFLIKRKEKINKP